MLQTILRRPRRLPSSYIPVSYNTERPCCSWLKADTWWLHQNAHIRKVSGLPLSCQRIIPYVAIKIKYNSVRLPLEYDNGNLSGTLYALGGIWRCYNLHYINHRWANRQTDRVWNWAISSNSPYTGCLHRTSFIPENDSSVYVLPTRLASGDYLGHPHLVWVGCRWVGESGL